MKIVKDTSNASSKSKFHRNIILSLREFPSMKFNHPNSWVKKLITESHSHSWIARRSGLTKICSRIGQLNQFQQFIIYYRDVECPLYIKASVTNKKQIKREFYNKGSRNPQEIHKNHIRNVTASLSISNPIVCSRSKLPSKPLLISVWHTLLEISSVDCVCFRVHLAGLFLLECAYL